jgi:uncharacterized membrane protein YkoI
MKERERMPRVVLGIAAAVATAALTAAAVAHATGSDAEGHITGSGARHAREAALNATDGGTATGVELDGENGATWEVEVTKPDGSVVDVRLDESYEVVVIESDGESVEGSEGDD